MILFNSKELTDKEFELMNVLWNSDKALTFAELIEKTEGISRNSIHKMLNKLMSLGYVKVDSAIIVSKTVSRLFAPAISAEEYTWQQMNKIFKSTGNKTPLTPLLQYLTGNKKYSKVIEQELNDIIKELESKEN